MTFIWFVFVGFLKIKRCLGNNQPRVLFCLFNISAFPFRFNERKKEKKKKIMLWVDIRQAFTSKERGETGREEGGQCVSSFFFFVFFLIFGISAAVISLKLPFCYCGF